MISIGKLEKLVKNEFLPIISFLSFLGGELIKKSKLPTEFWVVWVEWGFIRSQIQSNEQKINVLFLPFTKYRKQKI